MRYDFREKAVEGGLAALALLSLAVLAGIVFYLFREGLPVFASTGFLDFVFGTDWYPVGDQPGSFFRSAPRGFLPGAEAGTYPDPFSLSTAFFCFFQKTCSPRRPGLSALPGSARHSVPQRRERVMHLHAASVNDFLFFF